MTTTKHWLGTAAAVLALGTISASAMAQGQPEMRREGEHGAAAQASPRETGRAAGGAESRAGGAERAAPDLKQSAKEGGQSTSPAARDQAESRESKPAAAQKTAEQPAKTESKSDSKAESKSEAKGERDQSAQRDRDQREGHQAKETAKDAAESKQKQGAAEDRKGDTKTDNRAADTNKPDTNKSAQSGQRGDREADRHDRNPAGSTQQSQDERKGRAGEQANDKQPSAERNQAAQPARPGNTAAQQNTQPDARQRDTASQTQTDRGRSSTTVSVNNQQRTRVFDQLHRDREFDQARTDVDIRVNVGERLPERVRPRRLPDDIVTIVPEYRGYDYTVVHDEIAIIDPRSREIVDVIPQGGARADSGYGSDRTRIVLSDDQRQILRRAATSSSSSTVGSTVSSSSGSSGPSCLSLQRVPDEIARSNPELASYQYLAIGDQVVLIDPQNQKVVQVIDQQQQQQ